MALDNGYTQAQEDNHAQAGSTVRNSPNGGALVVDQRQVDGTEDARGQGMHIG